MLMDQLWKQSNKAETLDRFEENRGRANLIRRSIDISLHWEACGVVALINRFVATTG